MQDHVATGSTKYDNNVRGCASGGSDLCPKLWIYNKVTYKRDKISLLSLISRCFKDGGQPSWIQDRVHTFFYKKLLFKKLVLNFLPATQLQ